MMDVERLISEVAVRHRIRIDEDDPAFCPVTLNQLVLEETAKKVEEDIRVAAVDFEQAVQRLHHRAGAMFAQQILLVENLRQGC